MTTRVVIEKKQSNHLPYFEVHLNVQLTAKAGQTNWYGNPAIREGNWQMELSPVGRELMDSIMTIPGLGGLMCGGYSFQFNMALAFDHADIAVSVMETIKQVLGDELALGVQRSEHSPAELIEHPSEIPTKLRELTS